MAYLTGQTAVCGCKIDISVSNYNLRRCYCGPEDYCYCYDYSDDSDYEVDQLEIVQPCSRHGGT